MPKFLGLDSKRGFLETFAAFPAAAGAGAGFLPERDFGGWSLRREVISQDSTRAQIETAQKEEPLNTTRSSSTRTWKRRAQHLSVDVIADYSAWNKSSIYAAKDVQ